jgi:hypothetical protein
MDARASYVSEAELLSEVDFLSDDFLSETGLLVDECIAQVRETARLDDDAVLPPLPMLVPRRDVVILGKSEMAGLAAGAGAAESGAPGATAGDGLRSDRACATTQLVSRRSGLHSLVSRWAVVVCAFVASAFASAAFLASPMGKKPAVVHVTEAARTHASHAVRAVTETAGSIVR